MISALALWMGTAQAVPLRSSACSLLLERLADFAIDRYVAGYAPDSELLKILVEDIQRLRAGLRPRHRSVWQSHFEVSSVEPEKVSSFRWNFYRIFEDWLRSKKQQKENFESLAHHPLIDAIPDYSYVPDSEFLGDFAYASLAGWAAPKVESMLSTPVRNTLQRDAYIWVFAGGNQYFLVHLNYSHYRLKALKNLEAKSLTESQLVLLRAIAQYDPSRKVAEAAARLLK